MTTSLEANFEETLSSNRTAATRMNGPMRAGSDVTAPRVSVCSKFWVSDGRVPSAPRMR